MAASFLRPSRFDDKDYDYLESRFSRHGRPIRLVAMWLLDVRQMRKIEQLIMRGNDETVMAFKGSQIGAVGMTAVASAIVSQLSSTTLQMHALSNVNWTASAFIIAALLFSVLATMLSCVQQQVLGTLNESQGVRIWLSNGAARRVGAKDSGNDAFTDEQGGCELHTSVASLLLLRLPNAFLLYGVTCFLLGFGLFLGFAWRLDLDDTPSRDSNFKVMIMYIVVGSVNFLGAAGVVKWKMGEVDQAEKVVGKDIEGGDDNDGGTGSPDDNGSDGGGEDDGLLVGKGRRNWHPSEEGMDHERIAKALEDAARAHRELAKLMKNAVGHHLGD